MGRKSKAPGGIEGRACVEEPYNLSESADVNWLSSRTCWALACLVAGSAEGRNRWDVMALDDTLTVAEPSDT